MNESLDHLEAIVPDLLIFSCAGCGEHLAARLQSERLLQKSHLRTVAGFKPCEVPKHDRPYCADCLNARAN